MEKWYDLYINGRWSGQFRLKDDAISEGREIFNQNPETCESVEVIKCYSFDSRDGGKTVYKKTRTISKKQNQE